MVVYVDLDGTLADTNEYSTLSQKEWWKLANEPEFFYDLPLTPWAKQLMLYLEDLGLEVRILSATGMMHCPVAQQKIRWVQKHFKLPKRNIITLVSGKDKGTLYAEEGAILIDDDKEVLAEWARHGGTPLLVSENVISDLSELITC